MTWTAVGFNALLLPGWDAALSTGSGVLTVAAAVVYTAGTIGAVPLADRARWTTRWLVSSGLLALGGGLVVALGTASSWLLAGAVAVCAVLLPVRAVVVVIGVVVAGLLVTADAQGTVGIQRENVIVLVSVAVAVVLAVRLAHTNTALRRARDEIADLAVAHERARIARDLHDVLGHSLTTVVVKTGLARRLITAGAVDRGVAEVRAAESLARQALSEVRDTVADARVTTLLGELAVAKEVLRAADVVADLPRAVDDVAAVLRPVFAHVVREGVTNAVRHSEAQRVVVRIGPDWISVADDGRGAGGHGEGAGLRGLRERLAVVGAVLDHGDDADGGFRLRAAVGPPPRVGQ